MDPFVDGSYYTYAGDAAFLFPFIEMCGNENHILMRFFMYIIMSYLQMNIIKVLIMR
jgi:hypothetical protein